MANNKNKNKKSASPPPNSNVSFNPPLMSNVTPPPPVVTDDIGNAMKFPTAPLPGPQTATHQLFDEMPEKEIDDKSDSALSHTLGDNDTTSLHENVIPEEPYPVSKNTTPWSNLFKQDLAEPIALKSLPRDQEEHNGIKMEEGDFQVLESAWGHCLIGYVAGRFPGKKALLNCCQRWGVKSSYALHESGWLVFKFESEEDMNKVLADGPYLIFNRPLLLKVMPKLFDFGNEEISKVPVWVKLRNLPLEMWNGRALSRILSWIGRPIRTDQHTASKSAISFARALVEVDVAATLIKEVDLLLPGGRTLRQNIEYENVPDFCRHCNIVGHSATKCRFHLQTTNPPTYSEPPSNPPNRKRNQYSKLLKLPL